MMGWVKDSTGHLEYGLYVLAAITLLGAVSMFAVPQLRGGARLAPGGRPLKV